MTKAEEIKKKIKELTESSDKLKNEVKSITKEVDNLKDELDREENKTYYDNVRKLKGRYIKYETSNDRYHNVLYIYVNDVLEAEDSAQIDCKSVSLVFVNNDGTRGQFVTYTYDIESSYGIVKDWEDVYGGYLKFNNIKSSTEVEFGLAKDMIKDLN